MPRRTSLSFTFFSILLSGLAASPVWAGEGTAGCSWSEGSHPLGPSNRVSTSIVFDDGSGSALYVGGEMITADDEIVRHIARWDGTDWSPVGPGLDGPVTALAAYDAGLGEQLYAAGELTTPGIGATVYYVSRWTGEAWEQVGELNGNIESMVTYDDGGGEALYVAGGFTLAEGVAASRIARWERVGWSAVGSGFNSTVRALASVDSGDTSKLVAGGSFTTAGGASVDHIAAWDGATWSELGEGLDGPVYTLASHPGDADDVLYAGGAFSGTVARWDQETWTGLPLDPAYNLVWALAIFDDGDGPGLYAAGQPHLQFESHFLRWDAGGWDVEESTIFDRRILTFSSFDDGAGAKLFAGGHFTHAESVAAPYLAAWDGEDWSPVGSSAGTGADGEITTMTVFDDGRGAALYAGGWFRSMGGVSAHHLARWDGREWTPVGGGTSFQVRALEVFDDGDGKALYAGGRFIYAGGLHANRVAKWDGETWSALGEGISSHASDVNALISFDDGSGPALYAGGRFSIAGGIETRGIARWDGTAWSAVGQGFSGSVWALEIFDDGEGPALYAAGNLQLDGQSHHVARWDGSAWTSIRTATNSGFVYDLEVFDDGRGPSLFAAGSFIYNESGTFLYRLARWDGATWSALGTGTNNLVYDLVGFDDGEGPALYAAGWFDAAGGPGRHRIAKWDGTAWSPLGAGMDMGVRTLEIFNAGDGPQLFAGGFFTIAGDHVASRFAAYRCPAPVFSDGFESGDISRWSGSGDDSTSPGGAGGSVDCSDVSVASGCAGDSAGVDGACRDVQTTLKTQGSAPSTVGGFGQVSRSSRPKASRKSRSWLITIMAPP